jgi:hypothetical protein
MFTLLTWVSDPNTPAWVQAVGSVLAICFAMGVPAWQRSNLLRDSQNDRARQEKEHLGRLAAGLRAEIRAALETTNLHHEGVEKGLQQLKLSQRNGAIITSGGPIQPGSMAVTDAIVYRQISAELGRLPPALITSVVQFYASALLIGRLADGAPFATAAYESFRGLAPRLKMLAALSVKTIDKFEATGFIVDADIRPTPEEVKELAVRVGYPIDQLMKERGFPVVS